MEQRCGVMRRSSEEDLGRSVEGRAIGARLAFCPHQVHPNGSRRRRSVQGRMKLLLSVTSRRAPVPLTYKPRILSTRQFASIAPSTPTLQVFRRFSVDGVSAKNAHCTSAALPRIHHRHSRRMTTEAEPSPKEFILLLSCEDRIGIVAAVTGLLASEGQNVIDSQQYGDPSTKRFFMRVHFSPSDAGATATTVEELRTKFRPVEEKFGMSLNVFDAAAKPKVMVMVSKIGMLSGTPFAESYVDQANLGHTLNDLLFRASTGSIPISIPLIVSNHNEFATLASTYGIPFKHLPVTAATKDAQEAEILRVRSIERW